MKVLDCFTGGYCLVDDEDHRAWKGYRWGQTNGGYICADFRLKGRKIRRFFLHRLIAKPEPWQQVHHRNRCRWDNRRENLECVSIEEHLKRHPNNGYLLTLAQERQRARAQWAEEQQFLSLLQSAAPAEV